MWSPPGYEIEKKIGEGGMARVFLGKQISLGRPVAIKVLLPGDQLDARFTSRFKREAKFASALAHRNIVTIHELGTHDDTDFIVMEYVDGRDLREILKECPSLPPEISVVILSEIANGLAAAHAQDTVHRDIKPGNILLSFGGEVKIADFGLARDVGTEHTRLAQDATMRGQVLGTPSYMSPEQALGREVDHRTDIFSLGVVAYECFTGRRPFLGRDHSQVCEAIVSRDPAPFEPTWPIEDGKIESVVYKMLQKDPDRRYGSALDVQAALTDCLSAIDLRGTIARSPQRHLGECTRNPQQFADKLRGAKVDDHLKEGLHLERMGVDKIEDALHQFEYVLALDSGNDKARAKVTKLTRRLQETKTGSMTAIGMPSREGGMPKVAVAVASILVIAIVAFLVEFNRRQAPPGPPLSFSLTSEPPGARILLRSPGADDFEARDATTPAEIPVEEPGLWTVRFELAEHLPVEESLDLADEPVSRAVVLERFGRIELDTSPPGARVHYRKVGSDERIAHPGLTPTTLDSLPPGRWLVTLAQHEYRPIEREVEIGGGAVYSLEEELEPTATAPPTPARLATPAPTTPTTPRVEPIPGFIRITTEPEGARIAVRRKGAAAFRDLPGSTPLVTEPLAAGDWQVQIARRGFETEVRGVKVASGESMNLALALRASAPGWVKLELLPYRDSDGETHVGELLLDGSVVLRSGRNYLIDLSPATPHTLEARNPAIFASQVWRGVEAGAADTTDLGRYEFSTGELRVVTRPSSAGVAKVFIDGRKDARRESTPYKKYVGTGEHTIHVDTPSGWRVQRAEVQAGEDERREVPADPLEESPLVRVEIQENQPCRVYFHLEQVQ